MTDNNLISIIIVNYKVMHLVHDLIYSIKKFTHNMHYECIVIDNDPNNNDTRKLKKDFSDVIFIENKQNDGFARAVNKAAKQASGNFLFLLNPDTYFVEDLLKDLIDFMNTNEKIGICGPKIVYSNGKFQGSYSRLPTFNLLFFGQFRFHRFFPNLRYFREYSYEFKEFVCPTEVEQIYGAAMLIRKQLFDELNGLDERFFMYYEETDFCARAKKQGNKIYFFPLSKLVHLGGQSSQIEHSYNFDFNKSRHIYSSIHLNAIQSKLVKISLITSQIILIPFFVFKYFGKSNSTIRRKKIMDCLRLIKWFFQN